VRKGIGVGSRSLVPGIVQLAYFFSLLLKNKGKVDSRVIVQLLWCML